MFITSRNHTSVKVFLLKKPQGPYKLLFYLKFCANLPFTNKSEIIICFLFSFIASKINKIGFQLGKEKYVILLYRGGGKRLINTLLYNFCDDNDAGLVVIKFSTICALFNSPAKLSKTFVTELATCTNAILRSQAHI